MGNPTIDPSKKARGSNQEPLRKKKRCRSRLRSLSFPSQCWLDRSPCSGWPDAPQHLPPPLLHGLPISPPIIRLRLPPPLFQPSPCCSSGWQQATCPISVTTKGSPSGHQGGTEGG